MICARNCFGILQFYICLTVLYKIICLQFFTYILLSVLLFYAFVSFVCSLLCIHLCSSVRSACCTLLRLFSEQLWIWCLGQFWSFDSLPNLMLKWIWCGSEGSYDDLYFRKQARCLPNFMLCYQRTFCLVFALSFTSCYNSNVLQQFGTQA